MPYTITHTRSRTMTGTSTMTGEPESITVDEEYDEIVYTPVEQKVLQEIKICNQIRETDFYDWMVYDLPHKSDSPLTVGCGFSSTGYYDDCKTLQGCLNNMASHRMEGQFTCHPTMGFTIQKYKAGKKKGANPVCAYVGTITGNVPHIEKRISGAALRKMCQKEYGEAADWYEN